MNYTQMTNAELSSQLRSLLLKKVPDVVERDRSANDLSIYQIELEILNRELREVQKELEISRENNAEMYHFAPVAYLNFDESNAICAVNLAGASFLKKERSYLLGMDFGIFLEPESAHQFREHLYMCRELGGRRSVQLRIRTGDDVWVSTLVTTVFNDRVWPKKGAFFSILQRTTTSKEDSLHS